MSASTLYLVFLADKLSVTAVIASIFTAIPFLISAIMWLLSDGDERQIAGGCLKKVFPIALAVVSLAILTPTTKELAAILVVPKIARSEVIQKEVPELYKLAKDALAKQLEEKK